AASLLYEHRPQRGVDWRERLAAFVAETDRFFDLLDGVMPELAWLDDSQPLAVARNSGVQVGQRPAVV
ncbi:hypothetical protein, partial [Pseudomonas aeruginosa]